jgi:hypothetical protein
VGAGDNVCSESGSGFGVSYVKLSFVLFLIEEQF